MQNVYENKNYKMLILIPLALMLVSIYFIPKIQLDSSLRGGISIQLQTNSTIDMRQLTQAVDAAIPGAQASVSRSPGGLSVTIAANSSLANAETRLISVYTEYGNYSAAVANATFYQNVLTSEPDNASIQALLLKSNTQKQKSLAALNTLVSSELSSVSPFITAKTTYDQTDADAMLALAKGSYSDASAAYERMVISKLRGIIPFTSYSYNSITATLGAFFLVQMQSIIIWAFVLMAIAVFFVFRNPIPSFTVVFGACNDIIVALGAMGAFGIPLGVASIGGILMLIGYSVDTDILSAIRILKRNEGSPAERALTSFKTGSTMTVAAVLSFTILFIMSYVSFIPVYFQISGVVLAGLVADLLVTWCGNTPMILWFRQRKEVRR